MARKETSQSCNSPKTNVSQRDTTTRGTVPEGTGTHAARGPAWLVGGVCTYVFCLTKASPDQTSSSPAGQKRGLNPAMALKKRLAACTSSESPEANPHLSQVSRTHASPPARSHLLSWQCAIHCSSPSRHLHVSPTSVRPSTDVSLLYRRVPAASQTNSRFCLYHGSRHVCGRVSLASTSPATWPVHAHTARHRL